MELSDVNNMVFRNILLTDVVGKSSSLLPHGVILLRSVYVFVYNDIFRTYINDRTRRELYTDSKTTFLLPDSALRSPFVHTYIRRPCSLSTCNLLRGFFLLLRDVFEVVGISVVFFFLSVFNVGFFCCTLHSYSSNTKNVVRRLKNPA